MELPDILIHINDLQKEINSYGKLDDAILKRIQYKFRLDWNYHSNAMEGNSLTQQETRSVMVNNITVEGKPLKDVMEIRGHDEVITSIFKIGKGELKLSERRIKEIHKAIMREDTPEEEAKVGKWKTESNHLLNYKGEKYEFVPPADVSKEMHSLIDWLNVKYDGIIKEEANRIHPVLLAFEFHIKYVSIHPFHDGNGRTARILMNLILIAFGYPPVIVKITDKNAYNQYLADIQAYSGNSDLFIAFMCRLLVASQELVLTAIKGGNIDEADDLDKKLMLLEKEMESVDPEDEIKLRFTSGEVFMEIYRMWIGELLKIAIPLIQKFNRFFIGTSHYISIAGVSIGFVDESAEEITEKFKNKFLQNISAFREHDAHFDFSANYGTFKKGGLNTFGCKYSFRINFDYTKYSVDVDIFTEKNNGNTRFIDDRLLHKPLSIKEMTELSQMLAAAIYEHIDYYTKKGGIR
ncbi:MAG: hypothetical protein JWO09_3228 [Bacteroidetes bacterium]|nr:hypothetical protein [Bacteroidota bacterium]